MHRLVLSKAPLPRSSLLRIAPIRFSLLPTSLSITRSTARSARSFSVCARPAARPAIASVGRTIAHTCTILKRNASITTTKTTAAEFDHELTSFLDCLLALLEHPRFESANLDINLADGVLSVASSQGTWVLNKHTPTRQIWLSSPMSGPRKYNFHSEHSSSNAIGEGWRGERDTNEELKKRLIAEWSKAFNVQIDPMKDFQHHHD